MRIRRRMFRPVAVVLLAHLGVTITGAWRASQPRLQLTHSGKRKRFFSLLFFSFHVCLLIRFDILTPTYAGDRNLTLFFLYSPVNAQTLLRDMWSTNYTFYILSLRLSLSDFCSFATLSHSSTTESPLLN